MSFSADLDIVARALTGFYEDTLANKRPVINQEPMADLIKQLELEKLVKEGGLTGKTLEGFLEGMFRYSTRLHHPNYLGHQVAAPHYSASLASLINGFGNKVSSIYEMSPVSVSIEFMLINWMLGKVGWKPVPFPPENHNPDRQFGGGVLLDGGSIANLTGLLLARSRAQPDVWEEGTAINLAVLVPSESHYSLAKAVGILGMGAKALYTLPTDRRGAIIPEMVSGVYERLINDDKIPMALVANACSTAVGIYDPLDEVGEFCRDRGLWYHIDGAHGASALLSDRYKGLLRGVEKADSLVWDAHKLLQTPALCAALLVRDHNHLDMGIKTNQEASYLFHDKDQPGVDHIHKTIETTKSAIGNSLFFVLATLGEQKLAGFIESQCGLALEAYDYINNQAGFECPVKPESNILCFRAHGDDHLQLQIRNTLTREGSFYITTAVFNQKRYLRLVFMSGATNLDSVKGLISRITQIKSAIQQD